jgi:hypothetical protein
MNLSLAAADPAVPRLADRVAGRLLNSAGIAALCAACAIVCGVMLPTTGRTATGLLLALSAIIAGELLSRSRDALANWSGNSALGAGYLLAAFFALATFYVPELPAYATPYCSWALELSVAALAAVHLSRHRLLSWAALPFTLALGAHAFGNALSSHEQVQIASLALPLAGLASVLALLWLSALSAYYKKLELRESAREAALIALAYRIAHEGYFVLAALNAIALPHFFNSLDYAPLWWSVETPVLLAISWRSRSFLKQAVVMGIWLLSAGLLLTGKMNVALVYQMAVPVSGLAMAACYRFLQSDWVHWQKVTGYAVYLYGSAALALALPAVQLGVHDAFPYLITQTAVLLAAALLLKDGLLQRLGVLAALGSLALFGSQYKEWNYLTPAAVVIGCYTFSLIYGKIRSMGGLRNSDFVPMGASSYSISTFEAQWLERGAGAAGYFSLLAASYFLMSTPYNTVAWAIEALLLIGFGFATDKVGHRFSGVVAIFAACAKLWILDLSGASDGVRTAVGFAAFGVCSITAGIFYLVEYVWKSGQHKRQHAESEAQEGQTGDKQ